MIKSKHNEERTRIYNAMSTMAPTLESVCASCNSNTILTGYVDIYVLPLETMIIGNFRYIKKR